VKDFMVKNHLWIFVNCQIENPAFDSQVRTPVNNRRMNALTVLPLKQILISCCRRVHFDPVVAPRWHTLECCHTLQTKETLTLKAASFGSKCELSSKFIDSVGKIGVSEHILAFANFKQNKELKKTDGAKRSRLLGAKVLLRTSAAKMFERPDVIF
jgi:DNA topoisomerase II